MTVTDDLMMRISLLGDGNAWPSTIELINDLADRIEALTAENERLRVALKRIAKLDEFLNGEPSCVEEVQNYVQYVARAALEGKQ